MYDNPLVSRYTSGEMLDIFSEQNRYTTWRKLWVSLARNQQKLGLKISDMQLQQMQNAVEDIDFAKVAIIEAELKHDVMAHLTHFADLVPMAKPVIHLGATSEYIKDNTDLILTKQALQVVEGKLKKLMIVLKNFCLEYKAFATLAYTHYQVAQPTTVGRRGCLWLQSFLLDYRELEYISKNLKFRGVKGATGTLASFKELFNGDYAKVKELNAMVTADFGFEQSFIVTAQTYDRKQDSALLNMLSAIGQTAHKVTNDIRLLQNLKELEEGFGKKQVGSSAMPYKKNPIKCERVSSLAKYLMSMPMNATFVASTQWLERTLDDSANRRLTISQSFFTCDAILDLLIDIFTNISVHKKVIKKNLHKEIPFLATENILMEAVKNGGDRQDLHEKIRKYSIETKRAMIEEDTENDLLDKILADKDFNLSEDKLKEIVNVHNFIGFAVEQVDDFINVEIIPIVA